MANHVRANGLLLLQNHVLFLHRRLSGPHEVVCIAIVCCWDSRGMLVRADESSCTTYFSLP